MKSLTQIWVMKSWPIIYWSQQSICCWVWMQGLWICSWELLCTLSASKQPPWFVHGQYWHFILGVNSKLQIVPSCFAFPVHLGLFSHDKRDIHPQRSSFVLQKDSPVGVWDYGLAVSECAEQHSVRPWLLCASSRWGSRRLGLASFNTWRSENTKESVLWEEKTQSTCTVCIS